MSKAFIKAFEHGTQGIEYLGIGTIAGCYTCQTIYGMDEDELQAAIDNYDVFDEGGFSWQDCDVCGSRLGGDRYVMHGYYKDDLIHLDVCTDCIMYHANGDLPEHWE